jgi:dephospho-CoA kinase
METQKDGTSNLKTVIGLTGYTGCGKSFVSRQLQQLIEQKGFTVEVIDADKLAKQIRDESTGAKKMIVEILGPQVYDENGISIPAVNLLNFVTKIGNQQDNF